MAKNQFAYLPQRGARDVLAFLVARWLSAFSRGCKFVWYCADVARAFDCVLLERLAAKLHARGLHSQVVKLLISWLQERSAQVVVGGKMSEAFKLAYMVFQGTVLGPCLWNVHYSDVAEPCKKAGFEEVVFADDLHAWKEAENCINNNSLIADSEVCQTEVHHWGDANVVRFESTKEGHQVLSRVDPMGRGASFWGLHSTPNS